ncbi:MAG: AraC family transcriptional regulator [Bradyrhizobium sp.]|jgi:AraC-like DNA-binding protein|uniref:helix-turn-helix transcriptional regulator n=1 Tax=Bradyrhizobium sp. TaxID=376 RepID=UPI00121F6CB6|nr:AraC family transcriptional regulator [Bradyrhizobium sp.]THD55267.1 MAG: AraC family transcriptional regulator [Bradyrhizobium sp.]
MTDPDSSATVRFSTADFSEDNRVAKWREHYGHTVLRAAIEPSDDASFEAAVASRVLPGLQLVSGRFTAARIVRTREMIADGNDDLSLLVNQTGNVTVSARGHEVALCENDAVLISSGETIVFDRRSFGESIAIRIPYATLSSMVVDVDDAIMHQIPRNTAALKLLTSYANTLLGDDHALATPALRHHVATHLHDLVALTLGATREAADVAKRRGMGAARLRAAKIHIMENVSCRDISIGSVASHLGVTPRYLQRLFESDGTTFSAFLLGRRLARAYRMLCEPQSVQRQVSTIAYDVGFGDLSYFNRCFRRLYGATPMEIRQAAVN